jgi:hypothetical protein
VLHGYEIWADLMKLSGSAKSAASSAFAMDNPAL